MSIIRHKPSKVKYRDNACTLDEKHKHNMLNRKKHNDLFDNHVQNLAKLRKDLEIVADGKKKNQILCEIKELESSAREAYNVAYDLEYYHQIDDILDIYTNQNQNPETASNQLNAEIPLIEENSSFDQEKYNEKTNFDVYFSEALISLSEQNQKKNKKNPKKKKQRECVNNTKPILSFIGDLTKSEVEVVVKNNATLLDEYLALTDGNYRCKNIKKDIAKFCGRCNSEMKITEAYFVCVICAEAEPALIESDFAMHKDNNIDKTKYPYKKMNHLMERLNQFQSKENINIPDEVYNKIKMDLKINRILFDEVTPDVIKGILKKYEYNRYYENTKYIWGKITSKTPQALAREQEESIKRRFRKVEEAFPFYKPPNRYNFLNYSFVLHKIFLLEGLSNYAVFCPLLKSEPKLRAQDKIWEGICKHWGWEYHPSIRTNRNF